MKNGPQPVHTVEDYLPGKLQINLTFHNQTLLEKFSADLA